MNTQLSISPQTPISFKAAQTEVIPTRAIFYFRSRLSNRLHSVVVKEFAKLESQGLINKALLAKKIGKKPEQITRWLGSSGNWTIETLSDLLLGMGLEPSINLRRLDECNLDSYKKFDSIENLVFSVPDSCYTTRKTIVNFSSTNSEITSWEASSRNIKVDCTKEYSLPKEMKL